MWVDTHCHLNDEAFKADCPAVIERAVHSGIGRLIVVGYDLESSREAVRMAKQYDFIYAAVGIHPHDAGQWNQQTATVIRELLGETKVVALGEIGLDYHYDYSPREEQIAAFRDQLLLAKQLAKPVIIHNREAHQDTIRILSETALGPAGGVMHCFSGSSEIARKCLDLGLYISFTGSLTFENAHKLRAVAQGLPLDRLLVETDAPYLTPHPWRGQRNEPERVRTVGEKLAEVQNRSVVEVMELTTVNAKRLFRID
ncbi:MAG TPA: TatD family hydrolase [Bacillota bacterium]